MANFFHLNVDNPHRDFYPQPHMQAYAHEPHIPATAWPCPVAIHSALFSGEKQMVQYVAQLEHLDRPIHPFDATHILKPVSSQIPPKLILFQDL